ncbi:maltase 1-like isoform X2 [Harmonia axyridis]|uniref:maltase 1-like isoform X2 n=1 Tax=Harmonia axyridis TaxID=115357 RepID=UPI001E2764B3|nr:maltase 1-like isoform X2 [Harmonia axyridis]
MILRTLVLVAVLGIVVHSRSIQRDQNWWNHATFYQIYPRSFKDSNNDGDGDLPGIIEKLPYLVETGVNGIWLSPIMESPQVDQGYDISNYYVIDPRFGTLDDLKLLIIKAHELGLKVILDFVPNHTSDQHEWFKASENRTEGYEDYYVWRDGTSDKPPNNWLSLWTGSAWQWSEKRQQYYLHQFSKQQPDLNYRNPKVHKEMKDILKFYMDLGIDGFRIDAIPYAYEDDQFRDEPRSASPVDPNDYSYLEHNYTSNLPETYALVYEWRKFVDDYAAENDLDSKVLMTEANADLNQTMLYYGTSDGKNLGAHFTFNFLMIQNLNLNTSNAYDIIQMIYSWIDALPDIYSSNWVIGNHDNRRYPTRYGAENKDGFLMLDLLLPGVAVTYNGEEFGQEDGEVKYEEGQDPTARDPAVFEQKSRDFERTPLQWDNTTNAGFNEGAKTWLPVSKKYQELNLKSQLDETKESYFQNYKALIRKRQEETARLGSTNIWALSNDALVLRRSYEGKHIAVAFKLGWKDNNEQETVLIPGVSCQNGNVAIASVGSQYKRGDNISLQSLVLQPHEAVVIDIEC